MKRAGIATAIAVALSWPLAATQSGAGRQTDRTPPRTATPTPTRTTTNRSQTVTVIGCLQSGTAASGQADRATTTTPGAAGQVTGSRTASTATGSFRLTDARITSGSSGPIGTSGSGAASGGGTTFMLEGSTLSPHVGHQVQITGTMIAGTGAGQGAASAPGGGAGPGAAAAGGPTSAGVTAGAQAGGGVAEGAGAGGGVAGGGSANRGTVATAGAAAVAASDVRLRVTSVRTLSSSCTNQ